MRKSTLNGIAFSMKSLFFVSGSVSANSIAIAKEFSAEHWVLVFTTSTALSLIVFVALAWLVVRVRSLEQEQARKFDWDCFKLESALVPFLILAPSLFMIIQSATESFALLNGMVVIVVSALAFVISASYVDFWKSLEASRVGERVQE